VDPIVELPRYGSGSTPIYRYSRGNYDPNVLFMPTHDTVRACLSVAMHAYSIIC
jgi:hypothetical protein